MNIKLNGEIRSKVEEFKKLAIDLTQCGTDLYNLIYATDETGKPNPNEDIKELLKDEDAYNDETEDVFYKLYLATFDIEL